jgi:hypothetical protein
MRNSRWFRWSIDAACSVVISCSAGASTPKGIIGRSGRSFGPCHLLVNGIPAEDAVVQLQLELQVVQSQLGYYSASIRGYIFESYEDTLNWMVANCSPED